MLPQQHKKLFYLGREGVPFQALPMYNLFLFLFKKRLMVEKNTY